MYEVRGRALLQLSPRWQGRRRAHGLHRPALIAIALAGCGRFNFDARSDAGDGNDSTTGGPGVSLVLPPGGQYLDLAISPIDDTVYALGRYGGVYRTLDDGASWTPCGPVKPNGLEVDPTGRLWASGAAVMASTDQCATFAGTGAPTTTLGIGVIGSTVYALGDTALYAYSGSWNPVTTGIEGSYFTAFGGDAISGLRVVGSSSNYIAVSSNGTNWTPQTVGIPTETIVDISVGSASAYVLTGASASGNGGIGCSFDGAGATWTTCLTTGGTAMAVDTTDDQHVVVATYDQFGETTDAFADFSVGLRGASGLDDAIIRDLHYTASGVLWAATDRGVFKSMVRPLAFTPALDGLAAWSINDIVRSGDDVYLATDGGVLHSRAGSPFTLSTTGITFNTNASRIAVAPNGTLIVPGRGIWGSTDQGQTWTNLVLFADTDGYYGEVAAVVGTRAFVGTYAGTLHRADPPYTDWTVFEPAPGTANIYALAGTPDTLFLATEGGLYVSTDSGESATPVSGLVADVPCGSVALLPDGAAVAACENGIWISNLAHTVWTQSLATGFHEIVATPDGRIVAVSFDDGIFVTPDRGTTWMPVVEPTARNWISALYDEADGTLVMGSAGHGLVRLALP